MDGNRMINISQSSIVHNKNHRLLVIVQLSISSNKAPQGWVSTHPVGREYMEEVYMRGIHEPLDILWGYTIGIFHETYSINWKTCIDIIYEYFIVLYWGLGGKHGSSAATTTPSRMGIWMDKHLVQWLASQFLVEMIGIMIVWSEHGWRLSD